MNKDNTNIIKAIVDSFGYISEQYNFSASAVIKYYIDYCNDFSNNTGEIRDAFDFIEGYMQTLQYIENKEVPTFLFTNNIKCIAGNQYNYFIVLLKVCAFFDKQYCRKDPDKKNPNLINILKQQSSLTGDNSYISEEYSFFINSDGLTWENAEKALTEMCAIPNDVREKNILCEAILSDPPEDPEPPEDPDPSENSEAPANIDEEEEPVLDGFESTAQLLLRAIDVIVNDILFTYGDDYSYFFKINDEIVEEKCTAFACANSVAYLAINI